MAGAQVGFKMGGFRKPTAPSAPAATAPVASQQVPVSSVQKTVTQTPNMLDTGREAQAYDTAYGKLVADPSFGQVSQPTMNKYYDMATQRAFGQGNQRINSMLAQYGYGTGSATGAGMGAQGTGAELTGRLMKDVELNRTGAELQNEAMGTQARTNLAGQGASSRYGALTSPAGYTTTTTGTESAHTPTGVNPYDYLNPEHPGSARSYPQTAKGAQSPYSLWGSEFGGGSQPVGDSMMPVASSPFWKTNNASASDTQITAPPGTAVPSAWDQLLPNTKRAYAAGQYNPFFGESR